MSILIKNGRLIDRSGERTADVRIEGTTIVETATTLEPVDVDDIVAGLQQVFDDPVAGLAATAGDDDARSGHRTAQMTRGTVICKRGTRVRVALIRWLV